MKYKITHRYCWYDNGVMIVKMYFINEVPFTFDELPDGHLYDQDLCREADKNRPFDPEDLYRSSFYLIDEEAHPCLFPIDLENPEDMPDDSDWNEEEENTFTDVYDDQDIDYS
jgi:hypothetical protein